MLQFLISDMVTVDVTPRMTKLDGLTESMSSEYIALKNKKVCAVEGYITLKLKSGAQGQNVSLCDAEHTALLCKKMGRMMNTVVGLTFSRPMRRTVNDILGKTFRLIPYLRQPDASVYERLRTTYSWPSGWGRVRS
jgi:hypothetical protein